MRQKIDAWFDKQKDNLIGDVCRLIDIKSVAGEAQNDKPYGPGPAAALEAVSLILESRGFEPVNVDNRVITADLNTSEQTLAILSHVDTVSAGDGWGTNPFIPVIKDGNIIGRGAADNKGPAIAAVYALCAAAEIAPELTKNCRLILGSAEETGHSDLTYYRKKHKLPPNVITPDSYYPVVNFEKGRLAPTFGYQWEDSATLPRVVSIKGGSTTNIVPNFAEAYVEGLPLAYLQALCVVLSYKTGARMSASAFHDGYKIKSHGSAAHAMKPELGVNAQTALLSVLAELPLAVGPCRKTIKILRKLFPHGDTSGEALGINMSDDVSGDLTLNFGVLSLGPTGFTADFDCRSPKSATQENLDDVVTKELTKAGFEITGTRKTPCHYTPAETPLVQSLLKVYENYTGKKGECLSFGGQTYVHDIEGGVAFGAMTYGANNFIHGANEFINIEDLILSAKMYTQAIIDICT